MRLTISKKLFLGFFSLVISMGLMFYLTKNILDQNTKVLEEITELRNPSLYQIEDLISEIQDIKTLVNRWGIIQSDPDTEDKIALEYLLDERLPTTVKTLDSLSQFWTNPEDKKAIDITFEKIKELESLSREVMTSLSSFAAYNDPVVVMLTDFILSSGGDFDVLSNSIFIDLKQIHNTHKRYAKQSNTDMVKSFGKLKKVVLWVGVPLTIIGFLVALFTVRDFTVPILRMKETLLMMAKGVNSSAGDYENRSDEIGDIARALNEHKSALVQKINFATAIGAGNFNTDYTPSSQQDELGNALVEMDKNLYELTHELEQKVIERTQVINQQKEEIEEKNKSIFSSISYALTIQQAILPKKERIAKLVNDFFVFYKPRDIVSGDFYWFHDFDKPEEGKFIFAAVDCTGHGIPGAFMSMIAYNLLNRIVQEGEIAPGKILSKLHVYTKEALRQDSNENNDGMDIVLYYVDLPNKIFRCAGAKNPILYAQDNELHKIRTSRNSIGGSQQSNELHFEEYEINFKTPTMIYLYTDGYQDQFGGKEAKKFLSKRFEQMLFEISQQPSNQQLDILDTVLTHWQDSTHEQIDDILVAGLRLE